MREAYEVGDEPLEIERRPRAGLVISLRLSPEQADKLQTLADAADKTMLGYLRDELLVLLS